MQRHGAMVVAMVAMGMVQPAIDQIIDMIAMRHRFMAAAGTMHMVAGQPCIAAGRVGGADRDDMFIHMVAMRMMQMPVVQIIDMAIMGDGGVATAGAMNMGVIGMDVGASH